MYPKDPWWRQSWAACVLLADLSKAFERVNPYWILALLRIKKAPAWLIAYTKFVLFHRRVTHKVLPSRTLRLGVDMGRSFSVYLFCLAMDPLFTYLNQIPGVLAVQGYVDDTTIAGDGQDLTWIENVESCYQALQTAGFVIDPHACYFAGVVINNRDIPHKCLSASVDVAWPGLLQTKPFPTAMAALLANRKRGYNTVLVRKGPPTDAPPNAHEPQQYQCIVAVYTFQQIIEMDEGSHMHRIGSFATLGCACKSKSHILCNVALRSLAQRRVEATRFGIQAIRSHAPSLGLALEGRVQLLDDGNFVHATPRTHLEEFNPAPARKMFDRLKSFSRPTLSIVAGCTGYNTFIPECHAFFTVLFWTHKQGLELAKAGSFQIYPQTSNGSGSKLRSSLISCVMLASPHYSTLHCRQLSPHWVSICGKAIHWRTFTKLAIMVDAPIVGNVPLFRIW